MWNKLKNLKLNIQQHVLIQIFGCCLLIFFVMALISVSTFLDIQDAIWEQGDVLDERLSKNLSTLAENNTEERLAENADLRALYIDNELSKVKEDVEFLAKSMSNILKTPERYNPRTIINTQDRTDIFSGEPYVKYSPAVLESGISASLAREVGIVSNFANVLEVMSKDYKDYNTSLYAASRNGYLIRIDLVSAGNGESIFYSEERRKNFQTYEPRNRPWYKIGEQATKPVFCERYKGSDGLIDIACVMAYYDSEGFAGVAGITYSVEEIYRQVADGTIGKTGFNFVLDDNGKVVLSTHTEGILKAGKDIDLRQSDSPDFAQAARRMVAGERDVLLVTVDGKEYYLAFAPMQNVGWSFGMLVEKDEVMEQTRVITEEISEKTNHFQQVLDQIFADSAEEVAFFTIILIVLAFSVSKIAARRITQPISDLTQGVQEISAGNLAKKVHVQTGDELENLADCFNTMTDELKSYMKRIEREAEEKERTRTEMDVARKIQESMLPRKFPAFPERTDFDIYASMEAAKAVGGDFYDFYLVDENHLVFTIADVSSKGVPAALFMVVAKTVLKNFALSLTDEKDLAKIVSCTNDKLATENDEMMFVTAFVGMLNLQTGKLVYVNAGHNSPLLYRKSEGRFEYLPSSDNLVLGIMEDVSFSCEEIFLAPDDTLFLYTDGVTEALSETDELYGEMRLLDCLNRTSAKNLRDLFSDVRKSLAAHVGQCEQSDDITMLAITWKTVSAILCK